MGKQFRKQAGGTLLGLIIGLIIGLGIAVVVAVTIKNTPLPFINKLGKPDKAPDPAAGKVGDPNKPLYGNGNAAKEAAKEFARRAEEEKAEAALSGQEEPAKPEAKPEAKPAPKASARADGSGESKAPVVVERSAPEKKTAAGTDKPQKADNADEKFTYYLQAGAFREQADAENAKAKLALMGVPASIAERQSENGTLYRVRIGPFAQLETMNRMRGKLTDNGVDVAVVKVPK